jgi:hypothetical protein
LTSVGEMESGQCFGNGREIWNKSWTQGPEIVLD